MMIMAAGKTNPEVRLTINIRFELEFGEDYYEVEQFASQARRSPKAKELWNVL